MTEKLPTGTLCWSLTAGFPLWPAVVMQESDVPESVLLEPHTPNQTLVRFFGSVSYGWMDVCTPFRDNFEVNSKPEGQWDGFNEALEEAKEYERTGQFIVLTAAPAVKAEDSDDEEEHKLPARRPVVRRKRADVSSDDDVDFGDSSDPDAGPKKTKKKPIKRKAPSETLRTAIQRPIKASKEQKLFAREIFAILKSIEKQLKESNLDAALALLKKFDPKTMTKRVNKEGLTVDAPGPYAQIETQVVHISRLGKFVHGLAKKHENDVLGPYASMLYRHFRSNARKELAIPDDIEAYLSNQSSSSIVRPASSEPKEKDAPAASGNKNGSSTDDATTAAAASSTTETKTSVASSSSSMDVTADEPKNSGMSQPTIPLTHDEATVPLKTDTMEVDL